MDWEVQTFGSGTHIVKQPGVSPHFYVYGPRSMDYSKEQRDRYKVCCDIRDYLNGGVRPKWLDDLVRHDEHSACDLDGTSICATGPSIDRNPPHLDWVEDTSDEAKDARARLMDRLFFTTHQSAQREE